MVDKLTVVGLVTTGLVQMALHPVKTYRLVVHGVGWHQ